MIDELAAIDPDERRMQMALREAEAAWDEEEVPIGCVIFQGDKLIGKAHNQRETLNDPTAHAEILAITQAAASLESWRLEGCTLYVTLEPCSMCAGAIVLARIERVVFGAWDPKAGACGSVLNVVECSKLNHQPQLTTDILADECSGILKDFFQMRRDAKRQS